MKNVLELLPEFFNSFETALSESNLIGVEPWNSLLIELSSIINAVDSVNDTVLNNCQLTQYNAIDYYGFGDRIISWYQQGLSYKNIANRPEVIEAKITAKEIEDWLTLYNNQSVLEKVNSSHNSIFDTETQLQKIFELLELKIGEIKIKDLSDYRGTKTSPDEVLLSYIGELRQTIKDANQLMAVVANTKKVDSFQEIVLDEINQIDPIVKNKILRRLKDVSTKILV